MTGGYRIIVLCTSRVFDSQVQAFIQALNEKIKNRHCRLWVYAINADLYWNENANPAETAVFDTIPYEITDALIIMDEKIKSHEVSERIIGRASAHHVPVIVVDGDYKGTTGISFDFAGGFESIVRHVVEDHSVRKLHMLAGIRGNAFSDERIAIFRKVLEEHSIPFDDSMVSYGEFWAGPAREATQALIDRGDLPEALICANDIMAINACGVLMDAGYRVPEDIIITGFDGYDEAFMSVPGIATVSCGNAEMADTVYRAVKDSLSGMVIRERRVLPRMIPNESCGCHRYMEQNMSVLQRFNNSFYRYQDDIRDLHVITTKMLTSKTPDEMSACMRDVLTKNMCCMVYEDCFRSDANYFLYEEQGHNYCVLYDSDSAEDRMRPFPPGRPVPDLERKMESGYPLIFQSLDYMNKPVGYVCYYYEDYEITNYAKTAHLTDMVSVGVGGYINARYQQYLLSKVEEMYRIDALTGLYNRLAFKEAFEKIRTAPENDGRVITVIMADLDCLKFINDNMGHSAGDHAIAAVANALQDACPPSAICVRFGGDEMLAFIPGCDDGDPVVRRIEERLKESSEELGFTVSASCGCSTGTISADMKMDELIRHVDERMYQVKQNRYKSGQITERRQR